MTTRFDDFYQRSIDDRDGFWAEQAGLVDWQQKPQQICDYSQPPFAKWFVGGTTNLCHNAIDRHLAARGDQNALIAISTETHTEKVYSYRELHAEVNRMAAVLQSLGVQKGDRVQIYMPMVAEACFAMLACVWAPFTPWCSAALPRAHWRRASMMPSPRSSSAPMRARAAAASWLTSLCWTTRSGSPATSLLPC